MRAESETLAGVSEPDLDSPLSRLGALIKEARSKKYEGKQEHLARELGVSAPHLSRLENGKSPPSLPLARRLAERLDLDIGLIRSLLRQHWDSERIPMELRSAVDKTGHAPPPELVAASRSRMRPVLGRTSAGPWLEAINSGESGNHLERYRFPIPKGHKLRDKNAFWVEVDGESMTGSGIEDGALLLVEQVKPANGEHALVHLDGKTQVKKWRELKDRYVLTATNPNYKPQEQTIWKGEDDERIGWAWAVTLVQPPARPL